MISNIKIIIILLCLFSCKVIFADNQGNQFYDEVLKKQKLKIKHDYNYLYGEKKSQYYKKLNESNNCKDVKLLNNNQSNKKGNWFLNIFKKNKNRVVVNNTCKDIDLYTRLVKSFKLKSDFNHPLVSYYEAYYFNHKKHFEKNLERNSSYISYILDELKKRNMPGEIALLPMIESSYRNAGVSRVGATGMWQFMPYTGKNYGLNQTNWYDGRKDFYASTDAALNYLQDLYRQFGDWELAISAYNVGENRISKEIEKAIQLGLDPKFENLNLPRETQHYLPKLIATRNFIINHKFYDLDLNTLDNPSKFVAINIKMPIDLDVVSKLSELDIDDIKELNYGYKIPVILPGKNRKLILPLNNAEKFKKNLKYYDHDKLSKWIAYKVLNKESVIDISKKCNIPLIQLKYINNITSKYVPSGKIILIPKSNYQYSVNNKYNNNFDINLNIDTDDIKNKSLLSLEEAEHEIEITNNFNKIKFNKKSSKNLKHKSTSKSSKPKNKSKNKPKKSSKTKKSTKPTKNNILNKTNKHVKK